MSLIKKGKYREAAVSKEEFKKLKNKSVYNEDCEPGQGCKIEIWSYPPEILSENGIVDKLSLYLCLKDTEDERVKGETDKIFEGLLK